MLSVETALAQILEHIQQLSSEMVAIEDAYQRVLAETIVAPHDFPPFANSSMDGYAVLAEDVMTATAANSSILTVVEDIPAGKSPEHTLVRGQAARIMTGAPIPTGATAVVPVEMTNADRHRSEMPNQIAIYEPVDEGAYIRLAGEDMRQGEIVLEAGRWLRAADIGVLAGVGKFQVEVVRRPKVAILATGDELLTPNEALTPGKIRDMNSYALTALVQQLGAVPLKLGIARDTEADVHRHLQMAVEQKADLILSSAGVSVGAFDVVRTVLEDMGAMNLWKVNMRPGKPLTFGHVQNIPFLGLPGNPVSTMVSFEVFARAAIRKMQGLDWILPTETVIVGERLTSDGRLTWVRVRLVEENDQMVAYSTGTQSSGAISSMVKADGLLVMPADVTELEVGATAEVRLLTS